jgi:hypothetical protein
MAISSGREIIQFFSFPGHRHKTIIYNIMSEAALSDSAFVLNTRNKGYFVNEQL